MEKLPMLLDLSWGERRQNVKAELSDISKLKFGNEWTWWCLNHTYLAENQAIFNALDALDSASPSLLAGKRIVDAGGAASPIGAYLALRGADVGVISWSTEPNQGTLPDGRVIPAIWTKYCDLEDTGLEPGSFDAVVSNSAVEHNDWEKCCRIVQHLCSLVKPGCPVVITLPAWRHRIWFADGDAWAAYHKSDYYKVFSASYLFDADAVRCLRDFVVDVAELETEVPSDAEYTAQFDEEFRRMWKAPGVEHTQYLSICLVFRRKP